MLHLRAPRQPEGVAHAQSPPGFDLLDDRRAAAEEGIALALLLLVGDRLAQPLIGPPVGRIDVVEKNPVGTLADMRIHVDDDMAVPTHRILLYRGSV